MNWSWVERLRRGESYVDDMNDAWPVDFRPFYPGLSAGARCLPIASTYLFWHIQQATGLRVRLVELANYINKRMPDYVVERAIEGLSRLRKSVLGFRVLMPGLAYKKKPEDVRQSPVTGAVRVLSSLGAQLSAIDASVPSSHLAEAPLRLMLSPDWVRRIGAVAVLTATDDLDSECVRRETSWLLDCCRRLFGANVASP